MKYLFIFLPLFGFSQLRFESGFTYDDMGTFHVITYSDFRTKDKTSIIYRDESFIDSAINVLDTGIRYYKDGVAMSEIDGNLFILHKGVANVMTRRELEQIKHHD